jgi:hypothetical protein
MEREKLTFEDVDKLRPSYLSALGSRSYVLFSAIANVRNNGSIVPLPFAERGCPADASKATLKKIPPGTPWDWSDYHSHTWFTLRELLDTDWDKTAAHFEMALFADDYVKWRDGEALPDLDESYYVEHRADFYNDKSLKKHHRAVTEEEMLLLLVSHSMKQLVRHRKTRHGNQQDKLGPYVVKLLPRSYRELIPDFIKTIPDMEKLGPPDNVRVIIAFDN